MLSVASCTAPHASCRSSAQSIAPPIVRAYARLPILDGMVPKEGPNTRTRYSAARGDWGTSGRRKPARAFWHRFAVLSSAPLGHDARYRAGVSVRHRQAHAGQPLHRWPDRRKRSNHPPGTKVQPDGQLPFGHPTCHQGPSRWDRHSSGRVRASALSGMKSNPVSGAPA